MRIRSCSDMVVTTMFLLSILLGLGSCDAGVDDVEMNSILDNLEFKNITPQTYLDECLPEFTSKPTAAGVTTNLVFSTEENFPFAIAPLPNGQDCDNVTELNDYNRNQSNIASPIPELCRLNQNNTRSNWNLINQESGICMHHFFCGFTQCNPVNTQVRKGEFDSVTAANFYGLGGDGDGFNYIRQSLFLSFLSWFGNNPDKSVSPDLNLPDKVFFPKNAGDVVRAIQFAKMKDLKISVKTSGHDYRGGSTFSKSLMINMRRDVYECDKCKDSISGVGNNGKTYVVECENQSNDPEEDLSNQACILAKARNKTHLVRVGGGDNWYDIYIAARIYNYNQSGVEAGKDPNEVTDKELEDFKVHAVGGFAGTVSPFGWTFLGGLSGNALGRAYGFGVDQVLMIEMVTADGKHVRFGPTEWKKNDDNKLIYPNTTEVSGVCNKNPFVEDQNNWEWGPCDEKKDQSYFAKLWKALRGGGGGYGVVTALYLQLHKYPGKLTYNTWNDYLNEDLRKTTSVGEGVPGKLYRDVFDFTIDFYLDSENAFNISQEVSNYCGSSSSGEIPYYYCYGDDAQNAFDTALGIAFDTSSVEAMKIQDLTPEILITKKEFIDFAHFVSLTPVDAWKNSQRAFDGPAPAYFPNTQGTEQIQIPAKWMVDSKSRNATLDLLGVFNTGTYWAFGGNAHYSSDGSDALPKIYRKSGVWFPFQPGSQLSTQNENFFNKYWDNFTEMYDVKPGKGVALPGYVSNNHASPSFRGPVKQSWNEGKVEPCSPFYTLDERDEKCFSLLEGMYGSDLLKELEAIKKEVDPQGMFVGYGMVQLPKPSSKPSSSCVDDPNFTFVHVNRKGNIFKKEQDGCKFVAKKKKKRCKKSVGGKKVHKFCPATCRKKCSKV